jgi:hypothetical protein
MSRAGQGLRPAARPRHRLRDDPYPDELDQEFCDEDQTLCLDGCPCLCCAVTMTELAR